MSTDQIELERMTCGYFPDKITCTELYDFPTEAEAGQLTDNVQHAQQAAFDTMLEKGFRRYDTYIYREVCPECRKCVPIRIRVSDFTFSKNQRHLLRKNSGITVSVTNDPKDFVTPEKVVLMKKYTLRHDPDRIQSDDQIITNLYKMNGLADERGLFALKLFFSGVMNMDYRLDGRLIGCGIVDAGTASLSSNYFYYDTDPAVMKLSPGTYSILREIQYCKDNGLPFYYLGYYIADCEKMSYKGKFVPHELRDPLTGIWSTGM